MKLLRVFLTTVLLVAVAASRGQEMSHPDVQRQMDEAFSKYLAGLDGFSISVIISAEAGSEEYFPDNKELSDVIELAFRRNKVSVFPPTLRIDTATKPVGKLFCTLRTMKANDGTFNYTFEVHVYEDARLTRTGRTAFAHVYTNTVLGYAGSGAASNAVKRLCEQQIDRLSLLYLRGQDRSNSKALKNTNRNTNKPR